MQHLIFVFFYLIIVGLFVCLMKALLRFSGFLLIVVKDATSLCENVSVVDALFIPAGFNTSFDWHERKVKRQSCSRRDTHPSRTMAVTKWQQGSWWFKIPLHWPYCWTRNLLWTKGSVSGAVNLCSTVLNARKNTNLGSCFRNFHLELDIATSHNRMRLNCSEPLKTFFFLLIAYASLSKEPC